MDANGWAWVTKTTAAEILRDPKASNHDDHQFEFPLRSTIQVRIRGSQFESPLLLRHKQS